MSNITMKYLVEFPGIFLKMVTRRWLSLLCDAFTIEMFYQVEPVRRADYSHLLFHLVTTKGGGFHDYFLYSMDCASQFIAERIYIEINEVNLS